MAQQIEFRNSAQKYENDRKTNNYEIHKNWRSNGFNDSDLVQGAEASTQIHSNSNVLKDSLKLNADLKKQNFQQNSDNYNNLNACSFLKHSNHEKKLIQQKRGHAQHLRSNLSNGKFGDFREENYLNLYPIDPSDNRRSPEEMRFQHPIFSESIEKKEVHNKMVRGSIEEQEKIIDNRMDELTAVIAASNDSFRKLKAIKQNLICRKYEKIEKLPVRKFCKFIFKLLMIILKSYVYILYNRRINLK